MRKYLAEGRTVGRAPDGARISGTTRKRPLFVDPSRPLCAVKQS